MAQAGTSWYTAVPYVYFCHVTFSVAASLSVPLQFKRCENLPTKKQLQATIARLLKQPATRIATGIKAVPRKLAYGIKAISELDEDKSKIVGDVAKPKPQDSA